MLEALPDSCLRAFTMPSDGLPGLNSHRLCPAFPPGQISRGGSHWRRFSLWEIKGWNSLPLRPPVSAAPFLLQQLFNPSRCLTASSPGGVLDLIAAVLAGLPPLGSFPKLAPKALRSIVQPTAQKLLGGGCRPLLQTFFAWLLLFDFIDSITPPKKKRAVRQIGRQPVFV